MNSVISFSFVLFCVTLSFKGNGRLLKSEKQVVMGLFPYIRNMWMVRKSLDGTYKKEKNIHLQDTEGNLKYKTSEIMIKIKGLIL